jgi:nitroreductase
MDTLTCITNRRSIRAFQDKPVPQDLLREIIATACWSPSYKNTQPWQIMVVSGAK